jgi:ATP synthase protein I
LVWCITAGDRGPTAMPSDPPEKESTESSSKDGALQSLVRVESLIQLGLLLPACLVIGWALGLALDHWLHLHWINVVGLIAGAIAGFVQTIRIVLSHSKE